MTTPVTTNSAQDAGQTPNQSPEPTHYVTAAAAELLDGFATHAGVFIYSCDGCEIKLTEDEARDFEHYSGIELESDVLRVEQYVWLLDYLCCEGLLEPAAGVDVLKMGTTTQAAEASYPEMIVKDMPSPLETAARALVAGLDAGTEIVALGALVERLRAALPPVSA